MDSPDDDLTDNELEDVAAAFDSTSDAAWERAFPDPGVRAKWRRTTSDTIEAKQWAAHFPDPDRAASWHQIGCTAETAALWNATDLIATDVITNGWQMADPAIVYTPWRKRLITVREIKLWCDAGVTDPEVAAELTSHPALQTGNGPGYGPDVAQQVARVAEYQHSGWDAGQLAEYLRFSATLPPVDLDPAVRPAAFTRMS